MDFNYKKFINKLLSFSPRQFAGETKTAEYIVDILKKNNITFLIQEYTVELPYFKKGYFKCDNKNVDFLPSGLKSGKIGSKDNIVSSLIPSSITGNLENINFNPHSKAISLGNYYNKPSVSISRNSLFKVIKSKKISGEIKVERKKHKAKNILVGNVNNPKKIFFAHYDSILKGAIDNASGVATMLAVVLSKKNNVKNVLYVFSANEEISFDWPYYWGKGYREFENKYPQLLKKASQIFVIDCVGNGKTEIIKDPRMILKAFPLSNIDNLCKKVFIVTGCFDHLMTVYHSNDDDGRGIKKKYLIDAEKNIARIVNTN